MHGNTRQHIKFTLTEYMNGFSMKVLLKLILWEKSHLFH